MTPGPDVAAERRAQIIQAAVTCFSQQGYNNTTMDDIAAESGLSKGSLYWYFDSKTDLFRSVVTSFFEDYFGDEALAQLEQIPTAVGKLRLMAQGLVGLLKEAEGFFNLFVEFWASSEYREQAASLWLDLLMEYHRAAVEIIEEGVERGELKPVDAESLVWAVMAAYDGLAAYATMKPGLDLDRVSETFIHVLLGGLEKS
jgi:AcrR family transcriptional regulator